jgi:hypothetical protein
MKGQLFILMRMFDDCRRDKSSVQLSYFIMSNADYSRHCPLLLDVFIINIARKRAIREEGSFPLNSLLQGGGR